MNMLKTIIPRSDQLNFDDFAANQSKTVKITNVSISGKEQPVAINYEGDNGKPYKPCKSMCRVLVHVWGADAKRYAGKSMTLFGDPKVIFGGAAVGGIRISHMSDIKAPVTMALTTTRANRKPYTVLPLAVTDAAPEPSIEDCLADIAASPNLDGLAHKFKEAQRLFTTAEQKEMLIKAKDARKAELTTPIEEPTND